jgi:hypothetical protein
MEDAGGSKEGQTQRDATDANMDGGVMPSVIDILHVIFLHAFRHYVTCRFVMSVVHPSCPSANRPLLPHVHGVSVRVAFSDESWMPRNGDGLSHSHKHIHINVRINCVVNISIHIKVSINGQHGAYAITIRNQNTVIHKALRQSKVK